jgi:membrane-bound lytic murein transglycosylase MltF
VSWESLALASTQALIRQVSDGTVEYAVVASNEAEALRNVYLNFERAFAVAGKQELVWAFAPGQGALREQVNDFFADVRRDGTLQRLIEHYYVYPQMPRLDAGVFQERMKSVLPQFRTLFQSAQEETGSNGSFWRRSRIRSRNGKRRRQARQGPRPDAGRRHRTTAGRDRPPRSAGGGACSSEIPPRP